MNADPQSRTFPDRIESARLLLRRYVTADGPALTDLVADNRDRLRLNFPETATRLATQAQAADFIAERQAQWSMGAAFCYAIQPRATMTLIGTLTIKNIVWNIPAAELSYFIAAGEVRRGYAAEAVNAVLQQAFTQLGFERILLRIVTGNLASVALADRLGFKREGLHRRAFRGGDGQLHDVYVCSMLAAEYAARPPAS